MNPAKNSPVVWSSFETPLGLFIMARTQRGLCALSLRKTEAQFLPGLPRSCAAPLERARDCYPEAREQLLAYLSGLRRSFNLELDLSFGTGFQQAVWQALERIPYGQTRSYRWVAEQVGRPVAFRAVGQANRANPLPILIPCHRVIAAGGGLGGYSGGLALKRTLLSLEASSPWHPSGMPRRTRGGREGWQAPPG